MGAMLGNFVVELTYAGVLLYAPFMSFRAVKSPSPDDDKQWLMFWVIWSSLSTVEKFSLGLLSYMPLYYEAKAAFVVYLMFLNGGKQIFDHVVDPIFSKLEAKIPPEHLEELEKDPQAFIEKYGGKVFDACKKKLGK
mmetsp:Transcript_85050/g.147553  ORF Transcript_85050/g.147553 Transcript_85050/m.147553 type:complete len:137 (-) Transcript_85050:89-499(-)